MSDLEAQADAQSQDGGDGAHSSQNTMMMKMLLEMKNKLDSMGAEEHELSEEEHSDINPDEIIDEDEEKEAEPVSQVLADYVTAKYMNDVPPEQMKRKMERYVRPRNVPALQAKKVRNCSDSHVGVLSMHWHCRLSDCISMDMLIFQINGPLHMFHVEV